MWAYNYKLIITISTQPPGQPATGFSFLVPGFKIDRLVGRTIVEEEK